MEGLLVCRLEIDWKTHRHASISVASYQNVQLMPNRQVKYFPSADVVDSMSEGGKVSH